MLLFNTITTSTIHTASLSRVTVSLNNKKDYLIIALDR